MAAEGAVRAAEWAAWIESVAEGEIPGGELRLGFDTCARLAATVVGIIGEGDEMVIRAMAARTIPGASDCSGV